jgi:hypothetical protein
MIGLNRMGDFADVTYIMSGMAVVVFCIQLNSTRGIIAVVGGVKRGGKYGRWPQYFPILTPEGIALKPCLWIQ